MDIYSLIQKRRSVRKYKDTLVDEEKLQRVLRAGCAAPSWGNRQCWRFVVIRDAAARKRLGVAIADAPFVMEAPIQIVVLAEESDSGIKEGKEYYLADCAIAVSYMMLAAANEGLASCCVTAFSENAVRNALMVPQDKKVAAILPLGYADETPAPTPRRRQSETVFYDTWVNDA
ncbi:MAG: nitroreductase family protein [Clostridiales bacterium]|jgi:nitroreductase|nr:nitroreductase family protein [Clostridiales bacterium]